MSDDKDEFIKSRKKLPKNINEKINRLISKNLLITIFIIIYFMFLNLGLKNIEIYSYIVDTRVFAITILILAISLFEKGYKKDNEGIFLSGIEALLLAIITLIIPYTAFQSIMVRCLVSLSFIYFAVYYAIKALIQTLKIRRDYKKGDIREIVQKQVIK